MWLRWSGVSYYLLIESEKAEHRKYHSAIPSIKITNELLPHPLFVVFKIKHKCFRCRRMITLERG